MFRIFSILKNNYKRKLLLVFFGLIISGLLEMIGIGILPSIIYAIQNYDKFILEISYEPLQSLLKGFSKNEALIYLSFLFFIIFLIKNIILFILNYFQNKVLMNLRVDLSETLLKKYLITPYEFFLEKKRSVIIRNFSIDMYQAVNFISSFLVLSRELMVITFLVILMIFYNSPLIFVVLFFFSTFSYLIFRVFKNIVLRKSQNSIDLKAKVIQIINEYFLSIKDVKLFKAENFLIKIFRDNLLKLSKIDILLKNLNIFPRLFLETISIGLITAFIIYLIKTGQQYNLLPNLILISVIIIRFLPAFSNINSSLNLLKMYKPSVDVIINEIIEIKKDFKFDKNLKSIKQDPTEFKEKIRFDDVSYSYNKSDVMVFKNFNFEINKGEFIGITGLSGSGKTTFLNLITGLLKPTKGEIYFDEKKIDILEKNLISYVPQDVYLLNETIDKNIAFGTHEVMIDYNKISQAVKKANIEDIYTQWMNKNEKLGDYGGKLSGGQKQRIGIARALYKDSPILILDESTSSLDKNSEESFVKQIYNLKEIKTIIFVSHRESAIKMCDKIYNLKNKKFEQIR